MIFIAAIVAYWPALSAGYIWDDGGHVTRPELRSLAGLGRIWFKLGATQQYYPLLHSAFWFEHRLWGDAPLGYHLINVLLHATTASLFATVLRRLAVPGAWFAALLFALHPVCVESVAWVSEQKNTLSAVLYLLAALAYLRFDETRRPRAYVLASALFVAALLTKTVTATLPAALLVVFWWIRGRLDWRRDAGPLLPWFALGIAGGLFTAHVERTLIGAEGADFSLSAPERLLIAGRAVWFYLGKLAWPADLIFIYPRWHLDATDVAQWAFVAAAIALLAVAIYAARRWPGPGRATLAALLLFGGTLFPVLGFFNVFPFLFSFVADHFQYLASLALFALAGAAAARLFARLPRWSGTAVGSFLLLGLGALTWSQAATYHDVFVLYRTTLARNPECWMAENNLGAALTEAGRPADAVPHIEAALRLRPNYAMAESNLGDDLTRLGLAREAIPHLERALQLKSDYPEAHNNLGLALAADGRPKEAIAQYEAALRLRPDFASPERNLGRAYGMTGRPADAVPHFAHAVALQPNFADAEVDWGLALMLSGHFDEARSHFGRALELNPNSVQNNITVGRALASRGMAEQAVAILREALALDPESADAHLALAQTLQGLGQTAEAREHFLAAKRLGAPAASH